MRHGRGGYRLGRTTAHRTSTLRNIAAGLFEHGQIVTTLPRAKAVQPLVENIVTMAKKGDLANRRRVIAKLGADRMGFEWMYLPKGATEEEKNKVEAMKDLRKGFFDLPDGSKVERNRYGELRKAPRLVKHIFDNVAPRFADRTGGYTRIVKLGKHRIGDAGELVLIQFVGSEDGAEVSGRPSTRRRTADKRTAFFKQAKKDAGKN